MKRLTGGDPIKARYMRRDFVEFTPSHLAILVTNHLPKVSGDDPAIWRRLRVVPFDVVIPEDEQDKNLDTRLQLEADGILSWAVAGLRDYLDRGLDDPDSVRAATNAYHTTSDALGQFISEGCHLAETVKVTAGALFDAWERWRKLEGSAEMSKKAFGLALDRRGFTSSDSNGKRWWHGICVLEKDEQ
jgi:putative DNA primase/helicase